VVATAGRRDDGSGGRVSLAPRFTPPASLTPAVNDPTLPLAPAQRSGPADDVLVVAGEAGVEFEVGGFDQVDEFAAGEPCVDVLEHGNDFGMTVRRLMCPEN
jgi:hypothetical protein